MVGGFLGNPRDPNGTTTATTPKPFQTTIMFTTTCRQYIIDCNVISQSCAASAYSPSLSPLYYTLETVK